MSQQVPVTETALVRGVIERLVHAGALAIRVNSGAAFGAKEQGRRFVRFVRWFVLGNKEQSAGVSDIISVIEGRVIFIECKTPGNVPTEAQRRFANEVRKRGGLAVVIEDLDQLEELITKIKA